VEKVSEKTIISAQVPTLVRDDLARLASQREHSLSAEVRAALRLHLRVQDVQDSSSELPTGPGGGLNRPAGPGDGRS
jgi:hypothetical protein